MTNLLQFFCNSPVRVSVLNLDPLPKDTPSGQQHFYPTEDGGFWADSVLHGNIQALRPEGPFWICKRRAKYGRKRVWDVWPAEPSQGSLTLPGERPAERVTSFPLPQPILIRQETYQPLGTGTDGPVALQMPMPAAPTSRTKAGKIPLDVACREIIGFVVSALKDSGEQWSDQSRQDLVSTIIISATKAGYTTLWNREDAA